MAAEITVRYWAGAQRAAGVAEEPLTADTVADLRAALAARAGFDRIAGVASFLVDGQQAGDSSGCTTAPSSMSSRRSPEAEIEHGHGAGEARLSVWVRGRVQGVGFRYWTRSAAQDLGLRGSAANLPDGRVSIVVEGPRERCAALLDALGGDPPGWVGEITHTWGEPTGEPAGFRVR